MTYMKSLKQNPWVRVLIFGKALLFMGLIISYDKSFRLGDKPVIAKEAPAKKDVSEPQKVDTPAPTTTAQNKQPAERKSFLSELLDLPPLDESSAKKEEIGRYLDLIERKKADIESRLNLLGTREQQLKNLETTIEEKIGLLRREKEFYAQTQQREIERKGERVDRLVEVFKKMEPKKAAPIFEKMDKDLVVALLNRISEKQVKLILEGMDAGKSVEITEYYGRVRSTREFEMLKEVNRSLLNEFEDCKGMPKANG